MNSPADEDLMLLVRNGNLRTLGDLFIRHQTPLFNFYLRMTGDRQLSEDLVQEVFFRILRYRNSYQPGASFAAWMYQIARNTRVDNLRKHKPVKPLDDQLETARDYAPTPDQHAESNEQTALLKKALARLAEDKRELILLTRFQNLKYDEVAQLLHCEPGAVKVRVHRAVQELRQVYFDLQSERREGRL
jgi:RNA polymerase sigma factor (sigma-70 family)